MIQKIILGAVALACISYVTLCSAPAKAATSPEQVVDLMSAFSTMKVRVKTTRIIFFWDAQANTTAQCYKFYVPTSVPTPPTGQGFYSTQWTMMRTSAIVTEEQCYAQP